MLQTYAKATRKELSQIITIYQSILEFTFEEVWIDVIVKHAKEDVDNMLDDINAKLIEVCDDYLKENTNIKLDKYQLSMIVMDLYTKTITQLPQPFYVQAKEDKNKVKDYVKANKEYSKKLKEVKAKNNELKKELKEKEKTNVEIEEPIVDTPVVKVVKKNIPIYNPSSTKETALTKQSKYKFKNNDVDTIATEFTF